MRMLIIITRRTQIGCFNVGQFDQLQFHVIFHMFTIIKMNAYKNKIERFSPGSFNHCSFWRLFIRTLYQ